MLEILSSEDEVLRANGESDSYTQTGRCIFTFLEPPWNIDTSDACFVVRQRLAKEGARNTLYSCLDRQAGVVLCPTSFACSMVLEHGSRKVNPSQILASA